MDGKKSVRNTKEWFGSLNLDKGNYLCIYLSEGKTFWKRVYIYIYIYIAYNELIVFLVSGAMLDLAYKIKKKTAVCCNELNWKSFPIALSVPSQLQLKERV